MRAAAGQPCREPEEPLASSSCLALPPDSCTRTKAAAIWTNLESWSSQALILDKGLQVISHRDPPDNFPHIWWDEVADELLHIVVDCPPLLDSGHDGGEVVIGQDHLRGGFSHCRAGPHGDADLRFLQGRSVIHAIPSLKGNAMAGLCTPATTSHTHIPDNTSATLKQGGRMEPWASGHRHREFFIFTRWHHKTHFTCETQNCQMSRRDFRGKWNKEDFKIHLYYYYFFFLPNQTKPKPPTWQLRCSTCIHTEKSQVE